MTSEQRNVLGEKIALCTLHFALGMGKAGKALNGTTPPPAVFRMPRHY